MARRKRTFQLKIGDRVTDNETKQKEGVVCRVISTSPPNYDGELPLYEIHWTHQSENRKRKCGQHRSLNRKDELIKSAVKIKEIIEEVEKSD